MNNGPRNGEEEFYYIFYDTKGDFLVLTGGNNLSFISRQERTVMSVGNTSLKYMAIILYGEERVSES